MNSLFVVALGFGLIVLFFAAIYLVYLKRQNRLQREMIDRKTAANLEVKRKTRFNEVAVLYRDD